MASNATASVQLQSRAEIEQRATEVRRLHGLETIPVDPVILANRLGIAVHNAKFSDEGIVGMIAKRGENVTLLVNQADAPFRKRFTIAHELGHFSQGAGMRLTLIKHLRPSGKPRPGAGAAKQQKVEP